MIEQVRDFHPLKAGFPDGLAPGFRRPIATHAWSTDVLVWLAVAIGVGAALDAFHIGHASLWTDEIFSRYYFDVFGLHFMWTDGLVQEPTPPTYSILLRGWMALFGDSEAALRSLSAVAYTACVPLIYRLAREFGTRRDAVLAAFLLVLSPFGLHFAQEARTYAMTLAPAGIVLLACAAFLDRRGPGWVGAAYVLGGTLCLYLHATLVFFVAAAAMSVAFVLLLQLRAAAWRRLLHWTALNAAVVVLGLPYLMHLAGASGQGGLDWIAPLRPRDVVVAVSAVTSGVLTPLSWAAAPTAALLLGALGVSMLRHRPPLPMVAVTVLIPGVFLALLVVVSLVRPILLPRVMCWTVLPICILTARQMLIGGKLRFLVMAAAVLAFGTGLFTELTTPNAGKEPWREVFADLAPALHHADLVVLSPRSDPLIPNYYGSGTRNVRVWDEQLPPTIMTAAAKRIGVGTIGREAILEAIAAGKNVVVISNPIDTSYLDLLAAQHDARDVKHWACGRSLCIEAMTWGPVNMSANDRAVAP